MKDKQMMERAREIADEAVCHLRHMYPATYNTRPKTAMISLRGFITNHVASALQQVRKEAIEETLKQIFDYSIAHGTTLLTSLSAITAITNHALNQESLGDGGKGE